MMNVNRLLCYTEAKKIDMETLEACSVAGGSSHMTAGASYDGHSEVHVDYDGDW